MIELNRYITEGIKAVSFVRLFRLTKKINLRKYQKMKLKYVELSNYKSIKKPVRVEIADSDFYTFIGKNGSGKSNVLKALELAVSRDKAGKRYDAQENGFKAVYGLELTEEELKEYFELAEAKRSKSNEIRIELIDGDLNIKWRTFPDIKFSFQKQKERVQELIPEFEKAKEEYKNVYKKFKKSINGSDAVAKLNFTFDGEKEFYPDNFWEAVQRLEEQAERMKSLLSELEQEVFVIGEKYDRPVTIRSVDYDYKVKLFEVIADEADAGGIVVQNLKKDREQFDKIRTALSQSIQSYNLKFKTSYEKINSILSEFSEIRKAVRDSYFKKEKEYDKKCRKFAERKLNFNELLEKTVFPYVRFIDNENSLLFYTNDSRGYYDDRKLNAYNTIVQSMDNFLKNGGHYEEGESLLDGQTLTGERLKVLVKILNDKCLQKGKPKFDKEIKYKLEIKSGRIELFVIEKDKTPVNFNNTSLGRRWYLTFLFEKRLLKEGDYLIVDEPAVFLHPQAQTEFRKELERLSYKGIKIYMSTHSPYMISGDWKSVYTVTIGDKGTEIEKIATPDDLHKRVQSELVGQSDLSEEENRNDSENQAQAEEERQPETTDTEEAVELSKQAQKELSNLTATNILLNAYQPYFFVEGTTDRVCVEKFAELLGYDLTGYNLYPSDGSAIMLIFYLCLSHDIKFIMLADRDNEVKPKSYIQNHEQYSKFLDAMKAHPERCYFIGEGEKGCLEDLFDKEEDEKFINQKGKDKGKINDEIIKEVKSLEEFSQKAINNFNSIFEHFNIPKLKKGKK